MPRRAVPPAGQIVALAIDLAAFQFARGKQGRHRLSPAAKAGRAAAEQAERGGQPRLGQWCQDTDRPTERSAGLRSSGARGRPRRSRGVDADAIAAPGDPQQAVVMQAAARRVRRRLGEAAPAVHRPLAAEPLFQIGRVCRALVAHEGQHLGREVVRHLPAARGLPDRADAAADAVSRGMKP